MKRTEMRCPECGRVVPTDELVCPDCGTFIDDTELEELPDEEQEASDSFEEEYQGMYQEEEVKTLRNLHTEEEMEEFDEAVKQLREACEELEVNHIELKRIYRLREQEFLADTPLISFAGTCYTQHCKKARGVCWLRSILNMLSRGVPADFIESWDSKYFNRVLGWLGFNKEQQEHFLQLVETW